MVDMNEQMLHNNLAKYYDRVYSFRDYLDEAVRLQNLIIKYSESGGNSLLDVACGTGLHIKYLKDDFSCTGVDVSNVMLKIARKNVKGVTFKEADMKTLRLGKQFDVIVCLLSSIGYVKTAARLEKTIQNFSKHLKKGGLALIEPSHAKSAYVTGEPRITTYDGREVKIARRRASPLQPQRGSPDAVRADQARHAVPDHGHEGTSDGRVLTRRGDVGFRS